MQNAKLIETTTFDLVWLEVVAANALGNPTYTATNRCLVSS